jgi:ribonuclease VapC
VIIDSSALVAILRREPEAETFTDAIMNAETREVSAASYLETGIVIDGSRDPIASHQLDEIIAFFDITIAPVTEAQAKIARAAYRQFGRGSGHGAGLNFGDCFSYALAKDRGQKLLFKGDDFGRTDVATALAKA